MQDQDQEEESKSKSKDKIQKINTTKAQQKDQLTYACGST